ncbi:autophagy-related protein 2 homolog A-like isoform X3 [Ornithodoros turicata]|uniref:autophagy-related protein 2 homolog A-like isoform X3 n=1 Tax=Ornithodoros turicata TaxID=34597 RepID=UPI0031395FAA
MPWFNWSDAIKKRACRYLLQRYLGQFLQEKLTLDQLTVDLYNGKGKITDVCLDVKGLNELGETYNLPIRFVDGFISSINVAIPWSRPLKDNTIVEVDGLMMTVQPKQRTDDASMFESMWGSMMSSMQLAEEYLKQDPLESEKDFNIAEPLAGLEQFAQAIETVFCRIKVRLTNTTIRVEHVPDPTGSSGVALEIRVKSIDYFDQALTDEEIAGETIAQRVHEPAALLTKKILLEGTSLYTDEFSFHRGSSMNHPTVSNDRSSDSTPTIVVGSPDLPPQHNFVKEDSPVAPDLDSDPIPISRLTGRQEIKLTLKQNESLAGPNVDVEFNLGQMPLFLSPRQVNLLYKLAEGFYCPGETCNLKVNNVHIRAQGKPMDGKDYVRIEEDLQKQISNHTLPSKALGSVAGWSTHSLADSDDEYLPMSRCGASHLSGSVTSDMDSSTSSSTYHPVSAKQRRKPKSKCTAQGIFEDVLMDLTHFTVRCSAVYAVILHDDVLPSSTHCAAQPGCPSSNTAAEMHTLAENFFKGLSGCDLRDLAVTRNRVVRTCRSSHLSVAATPVTLEGTEKSSPCQWMLSISMSILNLEVLECLLDGVESSDSSLRDAQYSEILSSYSKAGDATCPISPFLRMKCEHLERTSQMKRWIAVRGVREPVTNIHIELGPAQTEVDCSLVDRIYALLHPPQQLSSNKKKQVDIWQMSQNGGHTSLSACKTNITLHSPFVQVNLRFPIPDLRPQHDMERLPWWQRNVRPDILTLELTEPKLTMTLEDSEPDLKFVLECKDAHALYRESPLATPVSFLRVFLDPNMKEDGFDWPRLEVCISPANKPSPLEVEEKDERMMPSMLHETMMMMDVDRDDDSPFTTRQVLYREENGNVPGSQTSKESANETDEVVTPADKAQLKSFVEKASNNCRMSLDFSLPFVELYMPDKHFYEVIYNRLTMDLVLWEPAVPQPTWKNEVMAGPLNISSQLVQESSYFQAFSMCRSGLRGESDDESDETSSMFHSVYENRHRHQLQQKKEKLLSQGSQTRLVFNVHITKGLATLITPLRDAQGNVVPQTHGEMQLLVGDAQLFVASCYCGNPDTNYVVVTSAAAELYHNGFISGVPEARLLEPRTLAPSHNLEVVLKKSPVGILPKSPPVGITPDQEDVDALSLVIKIEASRKQDLKVITVAVGINGTTMRHRMAPLSQNWVKQFIDFFDVLDYPIMGYTPLGVVTELHLGFSDCAIDYRPKYIPYRAVVTMENFSISSNIAAKTPTSLLRIIAEEVCLYISDKVSKEEPNLSRDYVCVVDTGLFDLTLRTTVDPNIPTPLVDLCASNNIVHVRTCADSCRALQRVVTYFASDGDLRDVPSAAHTVAAPSSPENKSFLNVEVDHFHSLMAEAMRESLSGSQSSSTGEHEGDSPPSLMRINSSDSNDDDAETQGPGVVPIVKPREPNEQRRGSLRSSSRRTTERLSDEEFCILENDPGTGIIPRSGEPHVRLLVSEPIRLIENHFSIPLRKTDQLRTPKGFPRALQKYTLREMSLVWHLYGGSDFGTSKAETKTQRRSDASSDSPDEDDSMFDNCGGVVFQPHGGVTFSKASYSPTYVTQQPPTPTRHAEKEGGPRRRTDVLMELQMNKIRFQHEVYPQNTVQASRQVLLIHDVEIRDRLASSEINKFLYQYASESMPRQAHANMVVLKMVHIRPDPESPAQECSIRVSLKPLRFNIDQDALLFLYSFFSDVASGGTPPEPRDTGEERHVHFTDASPSSLEPSSSCGLTPTEPGQLFIVLQDETLEAQDLISTGGTSPPTGSTSPLFIRSFVFSPDVPIRVDYHGKRVAMDQGALAGLLMGLGQLNCLEVTLKTLSYRHGLLGVDKVLAYACNEWLNDIKKNQVPSVLGGVGPMHSFVQLFNGVKDLLWLPVEQYRKDGRIVRGLQRGASSFTTSTAMACLELTNKLVQTIQGAAELAYDMLSPGPSLKAEAHNQNYRVYPNTQPVDIREGVTNAYHVVTEGLGATARTLVHAASQEHRQKGMSGAVGGVLRQLPPTMVRPIILATEATSNVLGGVRNQLVPDARREAVEKWRQGGTQQSPLAAASR